MNIVITRSRTRSADGWRIWEIVGRRQKTGRPLVIDWEGLHPTAQSALDRVVAAVIALAHPVTLAVEPTAPRWTEEKSQ